jgi:hypothetical protein
MCPYDRPSEPERATISEGVSPEVLEPKTDLELTYEQTLKGVELARHHLALAQQRALMEARELAYELKERIDREETKRREVLAELAKLKNELASDPYLLWEAEAPQSDNPALPNYDPTLLNEKELPNE